MKRRQFLTGLLTLPFFSYACHNTKKQPSSFPEHTSRGKALIINSDTEVRHKENQLRAQKFLLSLGYGSKDILHLSPPDNHFAQTTLTDLEQAISRSHFSLPQVAGPATRTNITTALNHTLCQLQSGQELFVYLTGHGYSKGTTSSVVLQPLPTDKKYDFFTDNDLFSLIQGNGQFSNGIVFVDACNGQGFAQNNSDKRLTAIAKNKFGQETACQYFNEFFFNAPHNNSANLNRDGHITLQEAARYAQQKTQYGGKKIASSLIINGSYNPALNNQTNITLSRYLFPVYVPDVRSMVSLSISDGTIDALAKLPNVVIVKDQQTAHQAKNDPHGVFYAHLSNCHGCETLAPYIESARRQPGKKNNLYVFQGGRRFPVQTASAILGTDFQGYPYLAKREGNTTISQRLNGVGGMPQRIISYGVLPDKEMRTFDQAAFNRFMS